MFQIHKMLRCQKISNTNSLVLIHHCMLRFDLSVSLFSFSLVLFARVFLFSLAPVYFFLLSSRASLRNRRPFHWNTVTHFQVPIRLEITRSYPIWFTHFSRLCMTFVRMTFFLSLSFYCDAESMISRIHYPSHSCSLMSAQYPSSFLKRSIPPHSFLHRRCTRLLLPFPLSFFLSNSSSSLIFGYLLFSASLFRFFLSALPTFFHLPRRLLAVAVASRGNHLTYHITRNNFVSQIRIFRHPFRN